MCRVHVCVDTWHAHAFSTEGPNSILNMSAVLIGCLPGPCCPSPKSRNRTSRWLCRAQQGSEIRRMWVIFVSSQSRRHHHLVGRSVFTRASSQGSCHPQKKKVTIPFPITPHQGVFGWQSTKHEARNGAGSTQCGFTP